MFTVGDRVICIEGHTSSKGDRLVEGAEYIVQNSYKCCQPCIDVGFVLGKNGYTKCSKCSYKFDKGVWWLRATRFASKEEYEESEKAVEALVEEMKLEIVNLK